MNTDPPLAERLAEVLDPHAEFLESGECGSPWQGHARHGGELDINVYVDGTRSDDAALGYRFHDVPPS